MQERNLNIPQKGLGKLSSITFENFIEEQIVKPGLSINESDEALSSVNLLIREALRRDWTVDKYSKGLVRFLDGQTVVGGLNQTVSSIVSSIAVATSNQKHATKKAFANSGLRVAPGEFFRANQREEAFEYFSNVQKPVVVKASVGSMGDSVSVNVSTPEEFDRAWAKAVKGRGPNAIILVERQFEGIDIRAYVVDGKMVAAVTRVPAFVVGNGRSTLAELIQQLLTDRKASAYLRTLPVRIDDGWIERQGLKGDSILENGRILTLNRTANTHQGAANFAITPLISNSIATMAELAARSIPSLNAVGIDLMIKSFENADQAILLEANASGSLLLHHYPAYGEPVDVACAIIDSMEKRHKMELSVDDV